MRGLVNRQNLCYVFFPMLLYSISSTLLQANVILQVLSAIEEFQDYLEEAARLSASTLVNDLLRVCQGITLYIYSNLFPHLV